MNCPSRTDDTLLHDEWNQNPPLLAPDLTTRQDLNGIANVRENRDGEKGLGDPKDCSNWTYLPAVDDADTGDDPGRGRGVTLTPSGMSSRDLK